MKHAKKMLAALLMLAIAAAMLAGCSRPNGAGEISDYDAQSFIPVGNPTGENDRSETGSRPNVDSGESTGGATDGNGTGTVTETQTQTGGFLVSEKRYGFGENDLIAVNVEDKGNSLVVLNVENQTDKNYAITINGAYLDENGETLKEETVTFEGFAAGWKNNFFFLPGIPFDKFVYTLQAEEYDGECLAQLFAPYWEVKQSLFQEDNGAGYQKVMSELEEWHKGGEAGDPPNFDEMYSMGIHLFYGFDYGDTPRDLYIYVRMLILSGEGEPVAYHDYSKWGASKWDRGKGDDRNPKQKPFYTFPDQEHLEWPEALKGNLTVLFSITNITDPPEPVVVE